MIDKRLKIYIPYTTHNLCDIESPVGEFFINIRAREHSFTHRYYWIISCHKHLGAVFELVDAKTFATYDEALNWAKARKFL